MSRPTRLFHHGLPGTRSDSALWENDDGPDIIALDWLAAPHLTSDTTRTVTAQFDPLPLPEALIHLIGFSLGAMPAPTIAAMRPARVTNDPPLSSSPWHTGHFAAQMAIAPVFRPPNTAGHEHNTHLGQIH